jgi:hypothetical protein
LVVDGEGGDLLDELQQIDCRVEERRLELLFEIRVRGLGLGTLDILRNVDECGDVDGELAEDGTDDVDVEDVVLGSLFAQGFDGLYKN